MNRLITTGRILAILTVIVGITHEVMTFYPMITDGMLGLDAMWKQTFTYFSLGCGGVLILCGLLFFMLSGRVERHEFLVSPLVAIGLFATADGIFAVCYMFSNPFAWVVSVLGLGLFLTAMGIRSGHRHK
jgi:hypothetical protein